METGFRPTIQVNVLQNNLQDISTAILIDKTVLLFKALISDFLVLQVILQSGKAFQILFYTKAGPWPRQRCYWAICWGFLKVIKVYFICEELRKKFPFSVDSFLRKGVLLKVCLC